MNLTLGALLDGASAGYTIDVNHVYLIDDSEDLRFFGKRAVELAGYRCRAFATADLALAELEAASDRPMLILTDFHMPNFDAEAFIARVRARAEWREIKIVLVSGISDLKRKSVEIGADGCLRKPFDLARIDLLLRDHLGAPSHRGPIADAP